MVFLKGIRSPGAAGAADTRSIAVELLSRLACECLIALARADACFAARVPSSSVSQGATTRVRTRTNSMYTHTKTWLRRQTRVKARRARPVRVKKTYDLIAQIGRARVCSLWLCSPPYFNIYHVKILQRSKIDNDCAARPCSGLALPVFQQTPLYRRRCICTYTCSTPASNSNTTSQWLVAHAVAGSSPAQIGFDRFSFSFFAFCDADTKPVAR